MLKSMAIVLLGAAFLGSCNAAKTAAPAFEVLREGAEKTYSARSCRYDRVIASAQGRVALFRDPYPLLLGPRRTSALGADAAFILEPNGGSTRILSKALELDVLGFDADGQLNVLLNGDTRVAVGASNHSAETLPQRRDRNHRFQPSRQGPLGIPHEFEADDADEFVRGLTFQGWERPIGLQVVERGGRLLLRPEGAELGAVEPLGLNHLRSFRQADGRIRISYAGEESAKGNGLLASALTDSSTGERVGLFGPRQLHLAREIGPQISVESSISPTDLLIDATVVGKQLHLLVEDWGGGRRLETIDIRTRRQISRALCGKSEHEAAPPGAAIVNIAVDYGGGEATMPGLLARWSRQPTDCLVVYYHGGPDLSIKDAGFGHYKQLAAKTGCDTVALPYSGSSGAGPQLNHRLKLGGFAALDEDAGAIKTWIDAHPQYDRIAIVGVSFGAAPALALKKSLGPRADAYLIGPVVSLKLIRDLQAPISSFFENRSKDHYSAFAAMIYGSAAQQDDFDRALAQAYDSLGGGDHVFAGVHDAKSPPDRLKGLAGQAKVHLKPGNHDLITGFAPIYGDISGFIAARARTAAP